MDPQNVDLKQTINLPKTAFPMKANLPQAEPKLVERWEQERLYHQIRASRAGRPSYVLHDGRPYANGRIHLGTAFNKILKDFIVKWPQPTGDKSHQDYRAPPFQHPPTLCEHHKRPAHRKVVLPGHTFNLDRQLRRYGDALADGLRRSGTSFRRPFHLR